MRCKKHYTDLSSINGVCASCLRERLFCLVISLQQSHETLKDDDVDDTEHTTMTNLDSPMFPRSVSPYITRRKTHHRHLHHHLSLPNQRFFSTPQLNNNNTNNNIISNNNFLENNIQRKKKKGYGFLGFSLLSNLFRSKKQKHVESGQDSGFSGSVTNSGYGGDVATSATSSPFWYGGGNSRKNYYGGVMGRKQYYCDNNRGMSPVRFSDCDGGDVEDETPWRTPAHHTAVRRGGNNGKNVSGLNFCLSPLVRASPCRLWNQKGMTPVMGPADGGDFRAHLANRSRKVADFGRFNSNR